MSRPYRMNHGRYVDEDLIYEESNYNAHRMIIYKLASRKANPSRHSARLTQIGVA